MATIAATISATGIVAPSYADILAQLQNSVMTIYGSDVVLTSDSQDGEILAIFAQAIYDVNQLAVAAYNGFAPSFAQGAALSSLVKLNGIRRLVPSFSTATVTVSGAPATVVNGGLIGDNLSLGTQWALPNLTIPGGGSINVTATCTVAGAVAAAANTLTQILTPVLGWNTVNNAAAAAPGAPTETDSALRQRQAISVGGPALTPLDSIFSTVSAVAGVQRAAIYENDTGAADSNGLNPHSIALVTFGGDPVAIATAIASEKSPGTGTNGTTSEVVLDPSGVPNTIRFYQLSLVPITVVITIKALAGWVATTGTLVQQVVAAFISQLGIGEECYLNRLFGPANLSGDVATSVSGMTQQQLDALSVTYNVTSILQSRSGPPAAADVAIAFNEGATCAYPANISLAVT